MDRRKFLQTGSLAALGALTLPSLAMSSGKLNPAGKQSATEAAMAHFGVTEADLKKVREATM